MHRLALAVLPRQGNLFQTTSIGRRKALKNVHLYTCSPCAKCHINIVTLLVDIRYLLFFLWNYFVWRHNHLGTPVTCPVVQQLFQNICRATHVITKPRPTKHVIGTSSIAVEKIRWITVKRSVFAKLFSEIYFDDPLLCKLA